MAIAIKDCLSPQWWAIAECADAYETQAGKAFPDLRPFVERLAPADRATGLAELVKIELERRWRAGERKHVEDFLREYPELNDPSISLVDLAAQESLVRSRCGDPPTFDELHRRFPALDASRLLPPGQGLVGTIALADSQTETKRSGNHDDRPRDDVPAIPGTIVYDSQKSGPSASSTAGVNAGPTAVSGPPAPAPRWTAPSGDSIGRYAIRQELGAGSFGVVLRCFDADLKRDVAIKLPHPQGAPSAERVKEFLHEAQSAARLRHPGIVAVLDTGQTSDGRVYIVYEFIRGATLQSRLEAGNFSLDDIVRWVASTAEALHHAHKNGIVHRDIKPANILLDEESRPHVADFGLAKMDDQYFTNDAGRVLGTANYMSPEQAAGKSHWATAQTDIYSLGIVLYQLLSKRLPFSGRNLSELLEQVRRRVPAPPRTIDDKIPKPLEDVCLKAMAKNPADRYSTAADMAAALRSAVAGSPPARRGRWWIGGLAAAAAASVAFLLIWGPRHDDLTNPAKGSQGDRQNPSGNVPASTGLDSSIPFEPTWPKLEVDYQAANDKGGWHVLNKTDVLHEGDKVQMHVTLGVPRYVYVFWYDVDGKPNPVWPRDPGHQEKTTNVDWPMDKNEWEGIDSQRGMEFLLVAARDEPLQGEELSRFETHLPYTKDAVRLDAVYPIGSKELSRGLAGIVKSRKDPLEPEFESALAQTFSAYHGLVIPHQAVAVESGSENSDAGRAKTLKTGSR